MSTKRQNTPKAIYNSAIAVLREIEAGNEKPVFVGIMGNLYKADAPKGVHDIDITNLAPGRHFLQAQELNRTHVYNLLEAAANKAEQAKWAVYSELQEGLTLQEYKDICFKLCLYSNVITLLEMAKEIADYGKKL